MVLPLWVLQPGRDALLDPLDASKELISSFKGDTLPVVNMSSCAQDSPSKTPLGFPKRLFGPLCWAGPSLQNNPESYVVKLDEDDVFNIKLAIDHFKGLAKPVSSIATDLFPLPSELRRLFREASKSLYSGKGFAVLRGLDPSHFSDEDNVIAFAGLMSYIGDQRATNANGMALQHIRDATNDAKPVDVGDAKLAPSKLPNAMKFHSDRFFADVIALDVISKADQGGDQHLASFWTVYNELMRTNPAALEVLASDWPWPAAQSPPTAASEAVSRGPIMFQRAGRVIAQLIWAPFEQHPELLSDEQRSALHAVNAVAARVSLKLDCRAGDIQLFNNLVLLHARDSYENSEDKSRHILRMGIRDSSQQWESPVMYGEEFNRAFQVPKESQVLPVSDFDPWFTTSTESAHHG